MISFFVNFFVTIVSVVGRLIMYLVSVIADLLGIGGKVADEAIRNKKAKKKLADSTDKVYQTEKSVYGTENTYKEYTEHNVVILSKETKMLSEHPYAVANLRGDPDAWSKARKIPIKYIVVALPDDQRIQFAVQDSTVFDMMFVGDRGSLTYKGNQFVNFTRYT